jgi:hypothetical protein
VVFYDPGMGNRINYVLPGSLTDLTGVSPLVLERVSGAPADICRPVHDLVIQPQDAKALGLPDARFAENQLRPAAALIEALLALDPAPLDVARAPERRVIGTCRHFAVLSCALLRHRGVAARVRCGFAKYFQAGQGLDHWITEYWHNGEGRWVRIDSEILGQDVLASAEDLRPGQFLSGGEAWTAFREGRIDAARFGVYGTGNWGPAEIRGNTVKDLAALNKTEMLPWDEWGRMDTSYKGQTDADYDELIDTIAKVCADDDPSAVAELHELNELKVPPGLIA